MVGEAAGELEHCFRGRVVADQFGGAFPANLDPGEEIGLGAGKLVEPRRLEMHFRPENLVIGGEGDRGATAVGGRAEMFERAERHAARETLAIELAVARHLDHRVGRQRIDHADADAVQAARGGISLAGELATGMQHGQNDFQRALVREFRVGVDRHAAAIVDDGQAVADFEIDLDARGMARDRLVHGIVEHFGGEMVKGALVGAADIHAGAAADGLQPLQHLDRRGIVITGRFGRGREQVFGHGHAIAGAGDHG